MRIVILELQEHDQIKGERVAVREHFTPEQVEQCFEVLSHAYAKLKHKLNNRNEPLESKGG